MAPVAALISLFFVYKNNVWSFLAGLLAGFLLWAGMALYANTMNVGLLAEKMGQLFQGLSVNQLFLVTGLIGGLLIAFGALTGSLARTLGRSSQSTAKATA